MGLKRVFLGCSALLSSGELGSRHGGVNSARGSMLPLCVRADSSSASIIDNSTLLSRKSVS